MEGTGQGGGRRGTQSTTQSPVSAAAKGRLPTTEPARERDGDFYFSFQFLLLTGRGRRQAAGRHKLLAAPFALFCRRGAKSSYPKGCRSPCVALGWWTGLSVPHPPLHAQQAEAREPVPMEAGPCLCVGGQRCPPAQSSSPVSTLAIGGAGPGALGRWTACKIAHGGLGGSRTPVRPVCS